ncbi:MAG: hypothetical protein ACHQPI_09110 [Thermoanaerobaculia bacterium]
MTHDHVTETPGRLRIEGRIGVARLFGLPFLLVGLWFLMQFLGGAADVLNGEVPFSGAAVGLAAILLVAVVFGLPGFLILLLRRYVVLDATTRTVQEVKDFRLMKRAHQTPFSEFREVLVRWEESGGSGSGPREKSIWLATVHLVRRSGTSLFLSHDPSVAVALHLARKASALAELPLRDETPKAEETEG